MSIESLDSGSPAITNEMLPVPNCDRDKLVCPHSRWADAEIERLRALLFRYQVANYIPEDCDLYAETQAALNDQQKPTDSKGG